MLIVDLEGSNFQARLAYRRGWIRIANKTPATTFCLVQIV